MDVVYFLAIAIGGYFLGGINGALITSKLVYGEDVRDHGSGNAGLTNFYRTYGSRAIFLVILIDILKTAAPVVLGGMLFESSLSFGTLSERVALGRIVGGLFAMLGHAYPPLYQFRGGKCVLSGGAMLLFLDLRVFGIIFLVFFFLVLLTRYISLGSISAGVLFPIMLALFGYSLLAICLAVLCGGLLVFRHRENITRLMQKNERKISFGSKKGGSSA